MRPQMLGSLLTAQTYAWMHIICRALVQFGGLSIHGETLSSSAETGRHASACEAQLATYQL